METARFGGLFLFVVTDTGSGWMNRDTKDGVGTSAHPTDYLPIQKRLKITPSKSSGVNSPVMLDS